MRIDVNDWVFTLTPVESIVTLIPLAFQNRVFALTY